MFLQEKSEAAVVRTQLETFGGYCHREVIQLGQWWDMENLAGHKYPSLTTRRGRQTVTQRRPTATASAGAAMNNIVCCCDLDGLVWIDTQGKLHTDGQTLLLPLLSEADLLVKQQMIPMGAYVIVWPARKWVNVQRLRTLIGPQMVPDCYGSIDASWEQGDGDNVRLVPCQRDGSYWKYIPTTALESSHGRTLKPGAAGGRVETSDFPFIYKEKAGDAGTDYYGYVLQESRPEKPEDGMLWMNPSVTPPVLQKWNEATGMWVQQELYLRLERTGGFAGLQEGDAVTVTLPPVMFCTQKEALQESPATVYYKEIEIKQWKTENAAITASGDDWICIKAALAQPATVGTKHMQLVQCAMFAQANVAAEPGTKTQAEFEAMKDAALEAYCEASALNSGGYGHQARVSKITLARTAPEMDFVIECGNRLWGCRYSTTEQGKLYNEIYASKLGDFKNWNCFAGLSTDSYAASRGTPGPWTGAVSFGNYPLFFKRDCMDKVYISASGAHQIVTQRLAGVQPGSAASLQEIGGVLYYLSDQGVMRYDGSLPERIGDALGDEIIGGGIAGSDGRRYWLSLGHSKPGVTSLFTLDTQTGLWHRQDSLRPAQFCRSGGALYAVEIATNQLIALDGLGDLDTGTAEGDFTWYAVTGSIGFERPEQGYLLRLTVRLRLELGASAIVCVQYDDGPWVRQLYLEGGGIRSATVAVRPKRCDHFRVKIAGIGQATLYSLTKDEETGSEET